MSQSEIFTLIVAVYGALLSTVIAIRELTKDKRRVKVTCNVSLVPLSSDETWEFISIDVVNIGHRPIQISSAGIIMSDGNYYTQLSSKLGKNPLPKKLEDGESFTIMFDVDKIIEVLKHSNRQNVKYTKAFVSDAEGNKYKARLPRFFKDKKLAK